jgi:hypothetical protein
MFIHILVGILGVIILIIILQDAFESVVLPRRVSRRIRLARLFYAISWNGWSAIARKIDEQDRQEYFLSYYGPLSLIMLLAIWAIGLLVGFALLQWADGSALSALGEKAANFGTDLYMSGTTLFTLGLGDVTPHSDLARAITVIESGTGLAFLALVLSYLPIIYQAFSRREVAISLLDAHAGSPPTAIELLRRHAHGQVMDELVEHLQDWEHWAAELLESHLSYPVLIYYRSQHDRQSWLAALTAILDVCALLVVGIDSVPRKTAWFTFAIASHAAVDLGQSYTTPLETRISRLGHDDFEKLTRALSALGIRLNNEETAEERLAELRQRYEPYIMALAKRLHMPLPGWLPNEETSDDWQTSAWSHNQQQPEQPQGIAPTL